MAEDWKDALSALRNNLEEADIINEQIPEKHSDNLNIKQPALSVIIDKKGRNGKIATIIEGFVVPQEEVEEIARKIKQKLGVGGSVRDGEILIQGNHKDKVKVLLTTLNFKVK